jgi:hypothetical protein
MHHHGLALRQGLDRVGEGPSASAAMRHVGITECLLAGFGCFPAGLPALLLAVEADAICPVSGCVTAAFLAGQGLRESRATDRTKTDDSSQPSSVARLSTTA